jgi:hypothetical protein
MCVGAQLRLEGRSANLSDITALAQFCANFIANPSTQQPLAQNTSSKNHQLKTLNLKNLFTESIMAIFGDGVR